MCVTAISKTFLLVVASLSVNAKQAPKPYRLRYSVQNFLEIYYAEYADVISTKAQ